MKKIFDYIVSRFTMKRQEIMFYDRVNKKPVYRYIDKFNNHFMAQSLFGLRVLMDDSISDTRECKNCGIFMTQGFCINNGEEYFCSENCLHTKYTIDEYEDMYDNGEGDSYYTEW